MGLTKHEIQAKYILPAVRKELTIYLVRYKKMTQKKAAQILDLTEGALSQYLSDKRGRFYLGKDFIKEIETVAERIIKKPNTATIETEALLESKFSYKIIKKGVLSQLPTAKAVGLNREV